MGRAAKNYIYDKIGKPKYAAKVKKTAKKKSK